MFRGALKAVLPIHVKRFKILWITYDIVVLILIVDLGLKNGYTISKKKHWKGGAICQQF